MNDRLHRVIGIDLGTTYSAVAACLADEPDAVIIPDRTLEPAADATPSVVSFDPEAGRLVVGHSAKLAMSRPGRGRETIIEVKREMGAVFTQDSLVAFGAKGTGFSEGDPVHVQLRGEWLRPQEVSALILMHMKEIAEREVGGLVHDAVVTVPAYFTERQKKATEEAARLAGLHPRQLIPEPTAAAIAYGVDQADADRKVYLVFDLGGGTFDVSIIETRENHIEVIATAGDHRLGGGDFDAAVAEWLLRKLGNTAPDAGERLRVLAAAEKAKRELSLRDTTTIDLGDAPIELDRAGFEELIKPILDRSLAQVDEALRFAEEQKGVRRDDVDGVLLVGGSTRIPRVRQMLLDHFQRDYDFVRGDGDPDTLVARGAAIVAHRFEPSPDFDLDPSKRPSGMREEDEDDYSITLITEHTLGVGVQDGLSDPLITRGTKIPARYVKRYTNPPQAQHIEANIYQGESKMVYENTLVGTVLLDEIEPRPEGFHQFDVSFVLDVSGLLAVKVLHVNANREFDAMFKQSTNIERVDRLTESRARLLRMREPETSVENGEVARDSAPGDAPFDIPPPVTAGMYLTPDEVPAVYRRMHGKVVAWLAGNTPPDDLAAALEEFEKAVRLGLPPADLEVRADHLEDAHDRARG